MSKVKGRYVGQLEINFEYDEPKNKPLNLDTGQRALIGGDINKILIEELTPIICTDDGISFTLTQMYGDAWRVEDESEI